MKKTDTIYQIYKRREIKSRTHNVCKYNGILTISDLVSYYAINGTFRKLRNCGIKGEKELNNICKKYGNFLDFFKIQDSPNVYDAYVFGELNTYCYHICRDNKIKTLKDLVKHYHKNNTFRTLKGCGIESDKKMLTFCKSLSLIS